MELEELKLYCKVDGDDEDDLLEDLKLGAEAYLTNAGVIKDYANPLYKIAIKLLSKHWHDNRELFINLKTTKIAFSLESIIFSLKYNPPVVVITP